MSKTPPPSSASTPDEGEAQRLSREAAHALAAASAQRDELHLSGARALHRQHLERALGFTQQVFDAAARGEVDAHTLATARLTCALAHAARADDARHGAGQLSRSAQRAPTIADCEDGWRRVEAIARGAETSALEAGRLAALLSDPRAEEAARRAETAAKQARRVVEERNQAYTFHADSGFSFGEGWYAAAAAVLADVALQIEPRRPHTAQAERFLRDAGLSDRLVSYRSRPRANKALPDAIAREFAREPVAAQAKLRARFLGGEPTSTDIVAWVDARFEGVPRDREKVLVWVRRQASHQPERNSTCDELARLRRLAGEAGLIPVLIGDALPDGEPPVGAVDLTLFWKRPCFQAVDGRRAQLQLFEHLRRAHRLVGQVGVTTAGMDGPALMGLPTMYLTDQTNPRMSRWVGAVPGYQEVVRDGAHLERVAQTFARWRGAGPPRATHGGEAGSG